MDRIEFSDWEKLDIRMGTVTAAEKVQGADKLLKLTVDLGAEARQIVSGIAFAYSPEDLVGKQMPVLANLAPRAFRGLESDGMILAASDGPNPVLLHPDKPVPQGAKVK